MSFENLGIGADIEKEDTDVIRGKGCYAIDTGLYPMIIDVAYLEKSKGGALGLNLHLKPADGGKQVVRQTLWITSGDKKGNKNYYVTKNNKHRLLPGMILADLIANITAGSTMQAVAKNAEKKTIKLYDFEIRAEKPTEVNAMVDMIGKPILVGIHKHRTNKNEANAAGIYEPIGKERVFNEIDKVFHPDGFSVAEKAAEAKAPVFVNTWKNDFDASYVNDTYKAVSGTSADTDALPDSDSGAVDSLFS